MRIFVTGATGFIGTHLVKQLAEDGHEVHVLYRNPDLLNSLGHKNIIPFRGSLDQPETLDKAMEGCRQVYHLAAMAVVWTKDPSRIIQTNLEGTRTIFELSLKHKVHRVVYTSTAGVMQHAGNKLLDETQPYAIDHFTAYEASKAETEKLADEYVLRGLDIVIVRPTRVYGPGRLSNANGTTRMIDRYLRGKWPFIPGNGKSIGNYTLVQDVARGHILAMEKGRKGHRYLLGGDNLDYNKFFKQLREVSGVRHRMFRIPFWMMLVISNSMMLYSRLTGKRPLITPTHVRKFNMNWAISLEKAKRELQFQPRNLKEGLQITLNWLLEQHSS